MKKFLFMLFAVVLSAMTIVSCSKDDSDEIDDAIIGTWKLTEVKMSETGSYIAWQSYLTDFRIRHRLSSSATRFPQ